jgi:hypothetical protein
MIDVKEATQVALSYFEDLYGEDTFSNVLLEPIERGEEDGTSYWFITIGFTERNQDPSGPLPTSSRRYKRFKRRRHGRGRRDEDPLRRKGLITSNSSSSSIGRRASLVAPICWGSFSNGPAGNARCSSGSLYHLPGIVVHFIGLYKTGSPSRGAPRDDAFRGYS